MIDVFSNEAAPQSIAKYAADWEHVSATYGLTLITLEQKFKSRWHSQQPHINVNRN